MLIVWAVSMAPVRGVQGDLQFSRTWQSIIPLHIAEARADTGKIEQRILSSAAYVRHLQACKLPDCLFHCLFPALWYIVADQPLTIYKYPHTLHAGSTVRTAEAPAERR